MKNEITWPEEGLYPDIDPELYFSLNNAPIESRAVSKSLLWKFGSNPRRWRDSPPFVGTDSTRWGSLIDSLTLTPNRFKTSYVVQPDTYMSTGTKKDSQEVEKPWNWNSNTCKKWREDLPKGVECISTYEFKEACKARDILLKNKFFDAMMDGGKTQVGMSLDFCGLNVTGMIDVLPSLSGAYGDSIVDLKTTASFDSPDDLSKLIDKFGYAVQAALYLDIYNSLTGEGRTKFYFAFQERKAPYEVAVIELSAGSIIAGRNWYLSAIEEWNQMLQTGVFKSPWDEINVATTPKWSKLRHEKHGYSA